MATEIGRNTTLAISDTDSAYTDIEKILSAAPSWGNDVADETNNDSAGSKESKYSDSQLTLSCSGKYDPAATGQTELEVAAFAKTDKFFRFRRKTGSGEPEYRAKFRITSFDVDTSTSEVQEFSFTLESTGTVTRASQ